LSKKTPIFCKIFRRKYLKNHNIGPRAGPNWQNLTEESLRQDGVVLIDPVVSKNSLSVLEAAKEDGQRGAKLWMEFS
jgi:hypothetical protein